MSAYPEHEKLKRCQVEVSAVSNFIDFIREQGWVIAEHGHDDFEGDQLWPIHKRPDEIIGLFFGIDPKKLEAEKRAMLEEIRKNDQKQEKRA